MLDALARPPTQRSRQSDARVGQEQLPAAAMKHVTLDVDREPRIVDRATAVRTLRALAVDNRHRGTATAHARSRPRREVVVADERGGGLQHLAQTSRARERQARVTDLLPRCLLEQCAD